MADSKRNCPSCHGLILQESVPSCVYCGASLGGSGLEGESGHASRLKKMTEHEQYPAAVSQDPPGDLVREGTARVRSGVILIAVGALALWLASAVVSFWSLVGVVAIGFGLKKLVSGLKERGAVLAHPLQKRPAIVTDRRSETAFNGWSGRVTYYFTMEFEDGRQGEFRYPGRGWPHEPLARGATVLAYTRGNDLLEFKSIKV